MEPASVDRICPTCGHALPRIAEVCPQCGRDDTNPFVSPAGAPVPEHHTRQRLVLGISVIVGVGILLGWLAPGIGIVWTVIATPTLVRAAAAIKRRREAGVSVSWEDRARALTISAGVAILAGIAATAAFVAVCFPTGLPFFDVSVHPGRKQMGVTRNEIGMFCAFGLGFVAAGAAGFFTMKRFWPRKMSEAKNG
ncbi:MAG TPA: hypothetical protein VJ783_29600 [Pirellulales bacterium]|nr:hypothetical protein [Pirellulales bacterium]